MPFLIAGIITAIILIGGASFVHKNPSHSTSSSTPTISISETSTPAVLSATTDHATLSATQTVTPITTPTHTPLPTKMPNPIATKKPTTTPTPTTLKIVIPTNIPIQSQTSSGFQCNCSKTCPNMASCEEAYFQLNNCECSKRDGDKDGVPCEEICPGG